MVSLLINGIPEDLRKRYKILCAEEEVDMSKDIRGYIERRVKKRRFDSA